jgi:hypothetical protein
MGNLRWEFTDADEPGVAYLSLPITGEEARSLLRGARPKVVPRAFVTESGRYADVMTLGWPGLYALSPSLSSTMGHFRGVASSPLLIDGGPTDFKVLSVTGRCGSVDYSKSIELDRTDGFVRLRGLHVGTPSDGVEVAVPTNLESVLVTARAAETLTRLNFENISLVSIDTEEFDITDQKLSAGNS